MPHTPGPWIVVDNVGEFAIDSPVESNNGDESIEVCMISHQDEDPQVRANARLIAAAPELLEALKELIDGEEKCTEDEFIASVQKARAVIAKVEEPTAQAMGKC
ncbi:MAG: hypothetical protein WCV62_05860 [Candidatus Peribacteraceae bacterium]|jgi:hypothetical protein